MGQFFYPFSLCVLPFRHEKYEYVQVKRKSALAPNFEHNGLLRKNEMSKFHETFKNQFLDLMNMCRGATNKKKH